MAATNGRTRALEPAEIAALEAEAEKHRAERDFFRAQTRKEKAQAIASEIVARTKQRDEKNELAKDTQHHVYVFDLSVAASSVKACVQQMSLWSRQDPGCDMELQINSPGGDIFSGFALIDFIRDLQCKGHEVTTVAFGMAASMGGVILQAGTTRVIGSNALLLIHEGQLGASGDYGEVQDRLKLMGMLHERILGLFEERAKPINDKTTKRYIRNHWERKDWWLTADDCLKLGFVDEVR